MVTTVLEYKGKDTLFITVTEVVEVLGKFKKSVVDKKAEELKRVEDIPDLMPAIKQLSIDLTVADYDYFTYLIDDLLAQMRAHLEKQQAAYESYMKKLQGDNYGKKNKGNIQAPRKI